MAAKKKAAVSKPAAEKPAGKNDVESGKTLAAVSYLWVAGLIILFTEKKNSFVRFHAKQATALFVIETVAGISVVLSPISLIAGLAGLYGLIMAIQGKETKIPLVYEFGIWLAKLIGQE